MVNTLFLVSASYDGNKLCTNLIFYDTSTNGIITIPDPYNHKPYCYVKSDYTDYLNQIVNATDKYNVSYRNMFDSISHSNVVMSKVSAPDPLSIGGSNESLRNKIVTWESDIKYYERYLFDNKFICGLWYDVGTDEKNNIHITKHEFDVDYNEVNECLKLGNNRLYNDFVTDWVGLLNQPIPDIKRLAVDIEVETDGNKIPSIDNPNKKIIAIGFSSSDGYRKVYVLNMANDRPNRMNVRYYESERELLTHAMDVIRSYPFIVTFNGDAFDLPYLYARCERLMIPYNEIPLTIKSRRIVDGAYVDPVYVKNAIHLDLYRFFKNRSIQNYAFSHKYNEFSLDAICKGILNREKIKFTGSFNDMSLEQLGEYCLNDADLTIELTTFNDNLLIKLMTMICRISKQPIDDICRYGINQWARGMFYYEMIKRNILIPRADELLAKGITASQEAVIKDKKYKGAFVFEPKKGVYFDVHVLDFASLYPSIIKAYNVSYETVNCPHQGCINNTIPETNSWVCNRKEGITSLIIGSLRDLRVSYYKYMSKKDGLGDKEHQLYDIVTQTLKVILNASYGIMGFESFQLYCLPVAESVTAYGRNIIGRTIDKAAELNIDVVYGDTDSIFVHNSTVSNLNDMISWTNSNFGIDLEADKHYRYLIMTNRKKNYLGITDNGKPDIKGLTGKKSHTPVFIRKMFFDMLDILCNVTTQTGLEFAKKQISKLIRDQIIRLKEYKISFNELAYNITISKNLSSYGTKVSTDKLSNLHGDEFIEERYKSIPQHIKAAKMLPSASIGSIISIIKTKDDVGVKPVSLVKNNSEIDIDKYIELISNTFEQVLESLDMDLETLISGEKQTTLDELFWE